MNMSGKDFLPNVYSLGYRSGQTIQSVVSWGYHELRDCNEENGQHGLRDFYGTLPSLHEIWVMITRFPFVYRKWWLNLLATDPIHVLVETTLLCCVVYMLFGRNKEYWKSKKNNKGSKDGVEKLTKEEEEELLREWREHIRQPLAGPKPGCEGGSSGNTATTATNSPASAADGESGESSSGLSTPHSSSSTNMEDDNDENTVPAYVPIIHKMDGRILEITLEFEQDEKRKLQPQQKLEVLNFANFDFLGMGGGSNKKPATKLHSSKHQKEQKDKKKQDESSNDHNHSSNAVQTTNAALSQAKTTMSAANTNNNTDKKTDANTTKDVDAKTATAITTPSNGNGESVKDAARKALDHYGCGSCGPRGFYGTIDVHLELEEQFSKFIGTDGAILYSDGASTCASTVAAFAKRGDLIIVDEGIYEPLVSGIKLSRAYVKWFKHNDMDDLRRVLEQNLQTDNKLGRKPNAQRRFIVCEGLYRNTGRVAPLDKIVALKHEFNCRLILDESHSFGTLGPTGRGALELYGKRHMYDAEIVTIALENAIGSIGGITVGSEEVVDHQRLSGSGYCFSASSPPFTASAAIQSLQLFQENSHIRTQLYKNIQYMYQKLEEFCENEEGLFVITSEIHKSCIAYIVLSDCPETESIINNKKEIDYLQAIVYECLLRGAAFVVSSFGNNNSNRNNNENYSTVIERTTRTTTPSNNTDATTTANPPKTTTATPVSGSASATNTTDVNAENNNTKNYEKKNKQNEAGESGLLIPPPAIRITVTAAQTKQDIDSAIEILKDSVNFVTKRFVDDYRTNKK